jgi:hypothetical protein
MRYNENDLKTDLWQVEKLSPLVPRQQMGLLYQPRMMDERL